MGRKYGCLPYTPTLTCFAIQITQEIVEEGMSLPFTLMHQLVGCDITSPSQAI